MKLIPKIFESAVMEILSRQNSFRKMMEMKIHEKEKDTKVYSQRKT